jgi:hypothetical protein
VSADTLERVVVEKLARAMARPDLIEAGEARPIWSPQVRTLVQEVVERIVVHGTEVQIQLRRSAPNETAVAEDGADQPLVPILLTAPLPEPPPRARKEILLPGGPTSGPRHVDHALVLALARARSWMRALRAGEYGDTADIRRALRFE